MSNEIYQNFKIILGSGLNIPSSGTDFDQNIYLGMTDDQNLTWEQIKNNAGSAYIKLDKIKVCKNILDSESDTPDFTKNDVGFKFLTSSNYDSINEVIQSINPSDYYDDTHKYFVYFETSVSIVELLNVLSITKLTCFFLFFVISKNSIKHEYSDFDIEQPKLNYPLLLENIEFLPISKEILFASSLDNLETVSQEFFKYCGLYEI
jgi:hypothetical protein